ncbi:MAG TPA: hypothetical protein PLQ21_08890, partial [Candidatus Kapabacteria bacterium]|nr:hypothetical protein [Candidatus Kapabacteria bacterium]
LRAPISWRLIAIKRHEIGARNGNKKAIEHLTDFAGPQYEFRTRQYAFNALKRNNYCDKKVIQALFDAMINPNTRLAGAAKDILDYFYQQTAFQSAIIREYEAVAWTSAERDELKKVIKR